MMVSNRQLHEERVRGRAESTATGDSQTAGPQRIFIKRRKSRSADSRRSKENDAAFVFAGRKRKATTPEDVAKPTSTLSEIPPHGRRSKKNKMPRRNATEGPAQGMAKLSINSPASSSDDEDRKPVTSHIRKLSAHRTARDVVLAGCNGNIVDMNSLKAEILELKKELELARASTTEQTQVLEAVKKELSSVKKINRKQGTQLEKLKNSSKKSSELLNTLKNTLHCQICLNLLLKPFALSPCGHVLCLTCLQEWFKSAPLQQEEIDRNDDEPIPTIYRKKTCPCCRTLIILRPTPVFLIKDLSTSFAENPESGPDDNSNPAAVPIANDRPEEDPWAGIFPEQVAFSEEEYYSGSEDEIWGDGYGSDASSDDSRVLLRLFSDEEGELHVEEDDSEEEYPVQDDDESDVEMGGVEEEDRYVQPIYGDPPYTPPAYPNAVSRRVARRSNPEHVELLQRGATLDMIRKFRMRILDDGIVAASGIYLYYLGWNIAVGQGDADGTQFMDWIKRDCLMNGDRWIRTDGEYGPEFRILVDLNDPGDVCLGPEYEYSD